MNERELRRMITDRLADKERGVKPKSSQRRGGGTNAYNLLTHLKRSREAGISDLLDPGADGTVNVTKDLGVLVIESAGARTLQTATQVAPGVRVLVLVTAASVTVNGTSIADGGFAEFIRGLDSSGTPEWKVAGVPSGVLSVADGGTNSGVALVGNMPMISSDGKIVEAGGEMADGFLLVGASGLPPFPATLVAGPGIEIVSGPYLVQINSATPCCLDAQDQNGNGQTGQPVRWFSDSTPPFVVQAIADSEANAKVIGVWKDSSANSIIWNGFITRSTAGWDGLTGGSGGLTPGATYYLSSTTEGRMTTTKPTTAGQFVTVIGVAFSPTTMILRIGEPIAV